MAKRIKNSISKKISIKKSINQSLAQTHPKLAKQANGWDPKLFTHGSSRKLSWKCSFGHVWDAAISNRAAKGSGCPFCAGQRVQKGINDLASKFPELAKEASGWDPATEAYGTAHKKLWVCSLGHTWTATVLSRSQGSGCPYCANNKVLFGFNDLATVNPALAREAFGWNPAEMLPKSSKKMKWVCVKNHTWLASLANRSNGTGCPICDGKTILPGFNDLATTDPEIALEANDWDPTQVTRSSSKVLSWKCSLGHEWLARVGSRHINGCPVCAGKKVLKGFNDLATTNRELAKQAVGWDPTKYSWGSAKKVKWRCSQNHEWSATIASRARLNRACPTCAASGYDPNIDAWLYLLEHQKWNLLQVGITNFPEQRLKKHHSIGWEILDVRGPMDGLLIREWESSILLMLLNKGAKLSPNEIAGKFDGYTESWIAGSFPVSSIKELMSYVEEDEG